MRDLEKKLYECRSMALSDPIPVRFSARADTALASISERSSLSKAELIRIAVDEFLHKTNETGEIVQRHVLSGQNINTNGHGNVTVVGDFASPSAVPLRKDAEVKRGKKKKPEK